MFLDYNWDFSFISNFTNVLLKGLWTTVELSILVIILATIIGTILGVLMSRSEPLMRYGSILVVDIIRSIPLIVLILWVYYLFPAMGLRDVSPFWPAMVALVINNSAFLGDVVRGSIEGLPKGSVLAARALGMDRLTILKRIILPEVYRETFPAVTFLYISIVRLTSLTSIIAVYEITHVGELIIATTFKPLEVYTVIAAMYLIVILPLTLLSRRIEKSSFLIRRTL